MDAMHRRDALRRLSLALGSIVVGPVPLAGLAGCRTPAGAPVSFSVLSASQGALLSGLVGEIIPPTDTPGAVEAGVPAFVDLMLDSWYAPDQRDAFLAELDGLSVRLGRPFGELAPDERTAFATALDREAYGLQEAPPLPSQAPMPYGDAQAQSDEGVAGAQGPLGEAQQPDSTRQAPQPAAPAILFFRQLKELTLAGYYTSEPGATQELQWSPAPGHFDPEVPLGPDTRADAAFPWK